MGRSANKRARMLFELRLWGKPWSLDIATFPEPRTRTISSLIVGLLLLRSRLHTIRMHSKLSGRQIREQAQQYPKNTIAKEKNICRWCCSYLGDRDIGTELRGSDPDWPRTTLLRDHTYTHQKQQMPNTRFWPKNLQSQQTTSCLSVENKVPRIRGCPTQIPR